MPLQYQRVLTTCHLHAVATLNLPVSAVERRPALYPHSSSEYSTYYLPPTYSLCIECSGIYLYCTTYGEEGSTIPPQYQRLLTTIYLQ
jgi:hypothetical protein